MSCQPCLIVQPTSVHIKHWGVYIISFFSVKYCSSEAADMNGMSERNKLLFVHQRPRAERRRLSDRPARQLPRLMSAQNVTFKR